ncbi:major facilitator superfamily domain-containing protein 1-like isoform X1 [Hydractinia symbiolongicarpus]|uniref:major facilitator superfamily domain-containing protein 1-like isoform X1 n=2 Tax=Hydractinia symbiolongicarpus TaxID=13093 RepID=UPI00254DC294|nr:major facilitator superfamily domain-containing protein 1-like isoform X1 [Hydractinia symbiolongicarpus]
MERSQDKSGFLDANSTYYRFVVLLFNCMLTFGSYFCFDMPSVLQDTFTGTFGYNCTTDNSTNVRTCEEHLGLSETQYGLLYSVYAWMNALVVIGSGLLIDKFGQRVGALLFSALCVIGSSIFAAGYFFKNGNAMFPVFLFGRLLFGAGNGSLTIAQNRISAFWFDGKELAFAFGLTLAFSRLGSILNFLLTENFVAKYGLKWTLWGGALLCALGFLSAILLYYLDKNGTKQLNKEEDMKQASKKMRLGDIKYLKLQFWLLVIITMFFYNTVFTFMANAKKFIEQNYGYDQDSKTPAYIAGSVYDVSLFFTPIFGILVDYMGYRGVVATICASLSIPVFAFLAFTHYTPLIGTILLGATYSAAACSLWPSAPLVVNPGVLGTALGLMTSVQMIGIGCCTLIVGAILDHTNDNWKYVMLFLFANAVACVLFSILLNIVDWKRGGVLNKTRKRAKKHRPVTEEIPDTDALISDENSVNT